MSVESFQPLYFTILHGFRSKLLQSGLGPSSPRELYEFRVSPSNEAWTDRTCRNAGAMRIVLTGLDVEAFREMAMVGFLARRLFFINLDSVAICLARKGFEPEQMVGPPGSTMLNEVPESMVNTSTHHRSETPHKF